MAFRLFRQYLQTRVSAVLYNRLRIFSLIHRSGLYPAPFRVPENSGLHRHLLAWDSPIHNYRPGCCGTDPADFTFYPYHSIRNSCRQKNLCRRRPDLHCCDCLFCIWGIISAVRVRSTSYEITINKDGGKLDELNIALIADLHLGYTVGPRMMRQMVDKINAQNPDIVLIAGDIFDNDYDAMGNPEELIRILSQIHSKYGTYAFYGKHDTYEKILAGFTFPSKEKKTSDPRMDDFLQRAGIRLITEETLLIDDAFYLVGRADEERPGRGVDIRKTPQEIMDSLDSSKPVIVMEHEPKFLQEIADAGIDLHLCGHTHDGQTFPANFLCKLVWENPAGYLRKDNMQSIVTSGVGLFGPNMRVGTKSEVVHIQVHFKYSSRQTPCR